MKLKYSRVGAIIGLLFANYQVHAYDFSFDLLGHSASAVLNNTMTFGAAWRIEDRKDYLVGKSNLDPDLCSGTYQACQGLSRTQIYPSERIANAPGMASMNFDDGNLNYDKGDIVQSPFKFNQDLKVDWKDYSLFVRGVFIYDHVNYHDFEEYHPNRITSENADQVAFRDTPLVGGNRVENRYLPVVYGAGGVVRNTRDDQEIRKQIGLRYDLLDANLLGRMPFWGDREILWRVGRQSINWGESTVAVINSVNQAQPVNVNSFNRVGFGLLEELFIPTGAVRLSTSLTPSLQLDAFYQFEWEPIEIPTPGTFHSFIDAGSFNIGNDLNASFGGSAEDPEGVAIPLNNPLTTVAHTTATIERLPDRNADDQGQFGFSLKYYADWLNNGTEFGAYFMNYHSKLPYVSAISSGPSCARREGNARGIDARNSFELLDVCPNLPLVSSTLGVTQLIADLIQLLASRPLAALDLGPNVGNPLAAVTGLTNLLVPRPGEPFSNVVPLDQPKVFLEYPEDLQMLGFSFNTTFGDYSFQGEMAYRDNVPLQVALVDLVFSALGPSLTRCHDEELGCYGTTAAVGFTENGGDTYTVYDNNDHVDADGNTPYPDTVNLVVGSVPGSARSFPSFLIPYLYGADAIGENPPNSYIQGWIPGRVMQYTLGATRVLGASENWIGADQVILLPEISATHVLNMPDFDELQIEGPLTATTHASAGANGSGADGSRLACSTNPSCSIGPDGLRFNPFQAPRDAFADDFSWGYRLVGLIRYESVLPNISVSPLFIFQHDISGNAPGPGGNFVEGRKQLNFMLETRYQESLSFNLLYNAYWGAGKNNLLADRDNVGFFIKYQF